MATLFYNMVEMITEWVTGIENGAIKLWELQEYLRVSANVTAALNGVIFGTVVTIVIIHITSKATDHCQNESESVE